VDGSCILAALRCLLGKISSQPLVSKGVHVPQIRQTASQGLLKTLARCPAVLSGLRSVGFFLGQVSCCAPWGPLRFFVGMVSCCPPWGPLRFLVGMVSCCLPWAPLRSGSSLAWCPVVLLGLRSGCLFVGLVCCCSPWATNCTRECPRAGNLVDFVVPPRGGGYLMVSCSPWAALRLVLRLLWRPP